MTSEAKALAGATGCAFRCIVADPPWRVKAAALRRKIKVTSARNADHEAAILG